MARLGEARFPNEVRPAGNVERDAGQRLVHRDQRVSVAGDAAAIAECPRDRGADGDAAVLGRVVRVDVEVADGADMQVDQ